MKKIFTKTTASLLMATVLAGSVFYPGDFAEANAAKESAKAEINEEDINIGVSDFNGTGIYDGRVDLSAAAVKSAEAADEVASAETTTLVELPVIEDKTASSGDTLVAQPEIGADQNASDQNASDQNAFDQTAASEDAATLAAANTDTPITDIVSIEGEANAVAEVSMEGESVSANDVHASAGAGFLAATVPEDMADDPLDTDEGGTDFGYTILGIANVKDHLNVRKTADDDSDLVGKMEGDAGCEILEVVGNKAHISSGSVEGYVSLDYLLTGNEAKAYAESHIKKIATVTADGLKIRTEADPEASVIALVGYNEDFEVVEEDVNGWVKILYDKKEGFVKSDYVKVSHKLKTALNMKELQASQGYSSKRVSMCEYAKQFLGNPYVWGGTSLTRGCDCSGYVLSIYAKYGVYLPHSSRAQAAMGTKTTMENAKPGDLVFYAKGGRINHVAMYIGGGQVIHASSPKYGIRITSAYYRTPVAVRSFF